MSDEAGDVPIAVVHLFVHTDGDGDVLSVSETDGRFVVRGKDPDRGHLTMVEFGPEDLRDLRDALSSALDAHHEATRPRCPRHPDGLYFPLLDNGRYFCVDGQHYVRPEETVTRRKP